MNDRWAPHHALVEHNRHEILDVPRGLCPEAAGTFVVHGELDDVPLGWRCVRLGVGEIFTGDDRLRIEDVERAIDTITQRDRVAAPANDLARWQRSTHLRQSEVLRDQPNISLGDIVLAWHLPLLNQFRESAWSADRSGCGGGVFPG